MFVYNFCVENNERYNFHLIRSMTHSLEKIEKLEINEKLILMKERITELANQKEEKKLKPT